MEEVILQCPLEYIELNDIFEKILIIFYVEGVKAPLPPLLQSEPPWRGNHVLNNCLPYTGLCLFQIDFILLQERIKK